MLLTGIDEDLYILSEKSLIVSSFKVSSGISLDLVESVVVPR